MPQAKRNIICPLFSFQVPTTCHLKGPSNKLKEACQVADSIINRTCLSWAFWQIKRTVSLLHRVPRRLSCVQQPPRGKDNESNALNVAKWPRRCPGLTMWSRLDSYWCCPSQLPQGHWCWLWTWSRGLKYPIWRPTGLFTWLHSSGDLRIRELTFCPWNSVVTMIMQYELACGQDVTEVGTDENETGKILDYFLNLDLF